LVRLCQAHPEWMLVWEDECWFSRFAQPTLKAWSTVGKPHCTSEKGGKGTRKPKR
jgi:hypothetical protein